MGKISGPRWYSPRILGPPCSGTHPGGGFILGHQGGTHPGGGRILGPKVVFTQGVVEYWAQVVHTGGGYNIGPPLVLTQGGWAPGGVEYWTPGGSHRGWVSFIGVHSLKLVQSTSSYPILPILDFCGNVAFLRHTHLQYVGPRLSYRLCTHFSEY